MSYSQTLVNYVVSALTETEKTAARKRGKRSKKSGGPLSAAKEYAAPGLGTLLGAGLGGYLGYKKEPGFLSDLKETVLGGTSDERLRNALAGAGIGAALGGLGGLTYKQHKDIGALKGHTELDHKILQRAKQMYMQRLQEESELQRRLTAAQQAGYQMALQRNQLADALRAIQMGRMGY